MSFSRWIPSTVWRPDGWFIYGIWRLFPCQVCRFEQKLTGHRKERLASSIRLAPSVGWLCGIGCASSSSGDHRGGNWEEIPSDSMRFRGFSSQIWQFLGMALLGCQGWPRRRNLVKRPRGRRGLLGRRPLVVRAPTRGSGVQRVYVVRIDLMIFDGSNTLMANVVPRDVKALS